MIRSAVTVSLVPEASGGPFVFWDGLEHAFEQAKRLGFDAVEIFAPGPQAVDREQLAQLVERTGCQVAAVGTGAGMVKHGLSLVDPDPNQRIRAIRFIESMIEFGAAFKAPAVIGSMQGRWSDQVDHSTALGFLSAALDELGGFAAEEHDVPLIYEPLNRYETNLVNTIEDGVKLLSGLETDNVRLLADLFHMNIEEADMAEAIRQGGQAIGHVHFVDSNRWAAGLGHSDLVPVVDAIKEIGFQGYISAEAFPLPSAVAAAEQTMQAYQQYFC